MAKVLVVGAGITGLTAAYELSRSGHDVTICEKSEEIGGLCASFRQNGFSFDYGPHGFGTDNERLVDLIKDSSGDSLVTTVKKAGHYFNNQYFNYPHPVTDYIKMFSLRNFIRISCEVIYLHIKNYAFNTDKGSFRKWVCEHFGPTIYSIYFGPYTEKVWGIDPDELDAEVASSRIAFSSPFDLIWKTIQFFVMKKDHDAGGHTPMVQSFYYFKDGIGTFCENLAKNSEQAGVKIIFNHEMESVNSDGTKVLSVKFKSGEEYSDFDYLINTSCISTLYKALGHTAEEDKLRYRSMIFVFLEVAKYPATEYGWIYYPEKSVCFQRLSEFTHCHLSTAPEGKTGLCAEISCEVNDGKWNLDDARIIKMVKDDLVKVGVLEADNNCIASVVRKPIIYPLMVIDYRKHAQKMLDEFSHLENLITVGRSGQFKYCNMDECMEMALSAADHIQAGGKEFNYSLDSTWVGMAKQD
ncbi:MAG: FAD-dependent oxidoreductase [Planctomycetota bacterium]